MDEGWAAVSAAAIGVVGTVLGAIFGYLGGRAQARGTVEGVELNLSGQRADALRRAEVDACALFVDACNRALLKLSHVRSIAELDGDQVHMLSMYGVGCRDDLLRELRDIQDECLLQQTTLFLRAPAAFALEAIAVRQSLATATDGMYRWLAARAGRTENEQEWRGEALARLSRYGQMLTKFSTDAQMRYSTEPQSLHQQ
ncbi:hypothetical protein AB5J55_31555 [Streptomyces sp. R11]|uniref:Secreted protein n=1 Tax=Streptomyces sp. R11 TaxID=3238625 RepID=A0AB39N7H5_9ACTN